MKKLAAISTVFAVALAGCGGGNGTSATLGAFTSFSALDSLPDGPFSQRIDGISQEAGYTFNTDTDTVLTVSTPSSAKEGAKVVIGRDARDQQSIELTSAEGTRISLSEAAGHDFIEIPAYKLLAATSNQNEALIVDPTLAGWDYQTFGIWITGYNSDAGKLITTSVGAATPATAIPTTGTATYNGIAGGAYVDPTGESFILGASMQAGVNFSNRTIAFQTTNTVDIHYNRQMNALNMAGTLAYNAGTNLFSGTVATVGGGVSNAPLQGTATGKFYGPAANEVGGTFAVSNGSLSKFIGGFGGRK